MTLPPRIPLWREKGEPEGSAVTGKAGKPGVVKLGLVSKIAAGQNNSNLTSYTASVVNGEWALLVNGLRSLVK
jgi:hypothetical protein